LDALSGLILLVSTLTASFTWVARLHLPFFHLDDGSGQAVQNQPEGYSEVRLQPSQASTAGWQVPPLKEHPFFVMNTHAVPDFTVEQSMGITSFSNFIFWKSKILYIINMHLHLSMLFLFVVGLAAQVFSCGPFCYEMPLITGGWNTFCMKQVVVKLRKRPLVFQTRK
jgi:hypothetical protein